MSNTKRHTNPYGLTAAYLRKTASLDKKLAAAVAKRRTAREALAADPANVRLQDALERTEMMVEDANYASKRHFYRNGDYVY